MSQSRETGRATSSPAKRFVSPPDTDDEVIDHDYEIIKQALAEINNVQNELDKLDEKASEEILKVESKYNKLRKPYYDQRATIIDKIDNFWATVLLNYPEISDMLRDEEKDCINFLRKVMVEEFENADGFRIKFIFDENPFFVTLELTKEFHFISGDKAESKSFSTTINWKEGMNLTLHPNKVMEGLKREWERAMGGMNREWEQPQHMSFFSWFLNNEDADNDKIADLIRNDLWINPLQYYASASDIDDIDLDEQEEEDGISVEDLTDEEDSSINNPIEAEKEDNDNDV